MTASEKIALAERLVALYVTAMSANPRISEYSIDAFCSKATEITKSITVAEYET